MRKLQKSQFSRIPFAGSSTYVELLESHGPKRQKRSGRLRQRENREKTSSSGLRCSTLLYLVQAARTGWPISNAGSAPLRGTNFCGRPPHTSAVYKLPSWSTPNWCVPHSPPGSGVIVPHVYSSFPFKSYL